MSHDQFLHDFVDEIKAIHNILREIVDTQITSPCMDNALFEKFGQLVSRIYGTATTLGFDEIGKYFFAIKEISYLCVHTKCEISQMKVLQLLIECVENLEHICRCIFERAEIEKMKHMFDAAVAKVEHLAQTDFHFVDRDKIA